MKVKEEKLELLEGLGFEKELPNYGSDGMLGYEKKIKSGYYNCNGYCIYNRISITVMNNIIFYSDFTQNDCIPEWAFLTLIKMYELDMLEE